MNGRNETFQLNRFIDTAMFKKKICHRVYAMYSFLKFLYRYDYKHIKMNIIKFLKLGQQKNNLSLTDYEQNDIEDIY